MKKSVDVKQLGAGELREKVKELREEIFRLRWQKGMKQLENTARIRTARKDLARVLTALGGKNK